MLSCSKMFVERAGIYSLFNRHTWRQSVWLFEHCDYSSQVLSYCTEQRYILFFRVYYSIICTRQTRQAVKTTSWSLHVTRMRNDGKTQVGYHRSDDNWREKRGNQRKRRLEAVSWWIFSPAKGILGGHLQHKMPNIGWPWQAEPAAWTILN